MGSADACSHGEKVQNSLPNMQPQVAFEVYSTIFRSSSFLPSLSPPTDINSQHRWWLVVMGFFFPRRASHEPPALPRQPNSFRSAFYQYLWSRHTPLSGHLNTKMNHVTLFLPLFSPPSFIRWDSCRTRWWRSEQSVCPAGILFKSFNEGIQRLFTIGV